MKHINGKSIPFAKSAYTLVGISKCTIILANGKNIVWK